MDSALVGNAKKLVPQDKKELAKIMDADEAAFKQYLEFLYSQIYRPLKLNHLLGRHHRAIRYYLKGKKGQQTEEPSGTKEGKRVLTAIGAIFGNYHADGDWYRLQGNYYIPVCTVWCRDAYSSKGIQSTVNYSNNSGKAANVTLKVAGMGFGLTSEHNITVEDSYSEATGSWQILAPVVFEVLQYKNTQTRQKAVRVRICPPGQPMQIDDQNSKFIMPKIDDLSKQPNNFGSHNPGASRRFRVEKNVSLKAFVPITFGDKKISLGYEIRQPECLEIYVKNSMAGEWDLAMTPDTPHILAFKKLSENA